MAADPTLARGAYMAARNDSSATREAARYLNQSLVKGIDKLKSRKDEEDVDPTVSVADQKPKPTVENKVIEVENPDGPQDKSKELQEQIQNPVSEQEQNADANALETNGDTTQQENLNVEDVLQQKRDAVDQALIAGDNTTPEQAMRDLDRDAEDIEVFRETMANIGTDWTNRSKEGGAKTPHGYGMALEMDDENKEWLMGVINSKERLEVDDSDKDNIRYGVYGPDDKFMTPKQLREYLVQFEVDNNSFNQLDELTYSYKDKGSKSGPTDMFDYDEAKRGVSQIVENGNLRSLTFDPNFGGTSYADDLMAGDEMSNITYASLGLKPPAGDEDGKIDPEDKIDDDLKKQIMKNFTAKDGVYFQEYKNSVIDYYTRHIQKNFDFGQSGVRASYNASKPKTADDYINEVM